MPQTISWKFSIGLVLQQFLQPTPCPEYLHTKRILGLSDRCRHWYETL